MHHLLVNTPRRQRQSGATLIEVLVSMLLLAFGMLSMGAMLSFAVQAPKLSGHRAVAANLASSYVERIRANPTGFQADAYLKPLSYDGTFSDIALVSCAYPDCTDSSMATMDITTIQRAARIELPAGGVVVTCDTSPCSLNGAANLWVLWQEPSTLAALDTSTSDNCPADASKYTNPKPRCLYVRFKI